MSFLLPVTRCPVCGDTSIEAVKHPQAFKVPTKQTATYRCSNHHTFYGFSREVERAHRLRGQARSGRTEANEHIRRAHDLQGKTDPDVATITRRFERIDTEEVVQNARNAIRKSRESRAKAKKLAESARERITDAKRISEKLLPHNTP